MIAQLMAQRALSLDSNCANAGVFRSALKLCAGRDTTVQQLARMQALLTTLPRGEISDLCQQALELRRSVLTQEANRRANRGFSIGGRARLVA